MAGDKNITHVAMDMIPKVISVWFDCVKNYSLKACAFVDKQDIIPFKSNAECGWFYVFFNALRNSIYHVYIKEYLDYFPSKNILALRTEDLKEPKLSNTMNKLFSFLKVPLPSHGTQERIDENHENANTQITTSIPVEIENVLAHFFRNHTQKLIDLGVRQRHDFKYH